MYFKYCFKNASGMPIYTLSFNFSVTTPEANLTWTPVIGLTKVFWATEPFSGVTRLQPDWYWTTSDPLMRAYTGAGWTFTRRPLPLRACSWMLLVS